MGITITFGWWLIPFFNSILGFAWAWQPKFRDGTPGGYFRFPDTAFFLTITAIAWALLNWLVYFIIKLACLFHYILKAEVMVKNASE